MEEAERIIDLLLSPLIQLLLSLQRLLFHCGEDTREADTYQGPGDEGLAGGIG